MPHQEHLPEDERHHAHRGREQGARARLVALILALAAALWPALLPAATTVFPRAEAVRSDWSATEPPAQGWEPVTLPDAWNARWPGHDGVVWYRLHWEQRDPAEPTALLLEYLNMAGRISVNGSAIWSDESLVEPLSRSWNLPRHFVLAPPLLRQGTNTLLVRVSGLATFDPGLGPVKVGPQAAVLQEYHDELFLRRDFKIFSFAVNVTLGSFFVLLWMLRRTEVAFGWYGLHVLLWLGVAWNQLALSPWPFPDTYSYSVFNLTCFALFATSFTVFVLRLCGRRWPRSERVLWAACALAWAAMVLAPLPALPLVRGLVALQSALLTIGAALLLVVLAWRGKEVEPRLLSLATAAYVVAGTHDLLIFFRVLKSNYFYADFVALIVTVSIAATLAWRYSRNLRRIESFSHELGREVAHARNSLAAHMQQKHALEVSHARIGERLNLVRDLHDGLGGTLTGSIAAIEQTPERLSPPQLLNVLKQVRDDLRLIIDASAAPAGDAGSLAEQLAPLRHRMSRLLEANGIACHWNVDGVEQLRLGASQTLDVLRFLQEALGNALKHSGASRVDVTLEHAACRLRIEVRDNGRGVDDTRGQGAGMQSMSARARRLGGEFFFEPAPGATRAWLQAEIA